MIRLYGILGKKIYWWLNFPFIIYWKSQISRLFIKLGDGKFTMWPNDTNGIHEDTGEGGFNSMGIHPLGFHKTSKNSFVGLLFNNINAQDLIIKSNK